MKPHRVRDLTGRVFNHWTFVEPAPLSRQAMRSKSDVWTVLCSCGRYYQRAAWPITTGSSKRCKECREADPGVRKKRGEHSRPRLGRFRKGYQEYPEPDPSLAEGIQFEPSLTCQVEGCSNQTRHDKPVCKHHVMLMPYAREVRRVCGL